MKKFSGEHFLGRHFIRLFPLLVCFVFLLHVFFIFSFLVLFFFSFFYFSNSFSFSSTIIVHCSLFFLSSVFVVVIRQNPNINTSPFFLLTYFFISLPSTYLRLQLERALNERFLSPRQSSRVTLSPQAIVGMDSLPFQLWRQLSYCLCIRRICSGCLKRATRVSDNGAAEFWTISLHS